MKTVDQEVWESIWNGISFLSERYGDRLVFIGGIAVYLHVERLRGEQPASFVEYSHDGDLFMSKNDYVDLKHQQVVTYNRNLNKHQWVKDGIDFDIYVEYENSLAVKYEDALAKSVVLANTSAACLEHLMVLKLASYSDRKKSPKGVKDERDLIRIVVLMDRFGFDSGILAEYLSEDDVQLLLSIGKSSEFKALTRHVKKMRDVYNQTAKKIAEGL